jgi:hypothetical protein
MLVSRRRRGHLTGRSHIPTTAGLCEPIPRSKSCGSRSSADIGGESASAGPRITAPVADRRARLDPLDPKTTRHFGACEFVGETDPAKLRLALKVKPALEEGYDWVTCAGCDCSWPVPHYAAESVR